MGIFLSMAVNPRPTTDVGNDPAARNWAALNQNGMIMVSHGLKVPHDTPDQPPRPWVSSAPGSWATPRWTHPQATNLAYAQDVGRALMVYDWEPGDLRGYAFDSYGALWPFGSDTPMAATGLTGAPYGLFPLNPTSSLGTTVYNGFQMHSANNLPFGDGGWPDGFGWFISGEGFIVDWGGPIYALTQPVASVPTAGWNGILGSGWNTVRDFQVNPDNSGQFYVLYDSGLIYAGCKAGGSPVAITNAQPSTDQNFFGGYRWMHVQWDEGWIISMRADGNLWGYNLAGQTAPFPAVPAPPPWENFTVVPTLNLPGWWQDGGIVPGRNPSRFYIISWNGQARGEAISGTIAALNPVVTGQTTTTRPLINWTWNAQYGVGQKNYNVRVYPTAVTTAGGFTAGQNNGAVWISDRTSEFSNDTVKTDLTNGAVYKAYVRATSWAGVTTPWENVSFTMAIPLPTQPSSLTATPSPGTYPTTFGQVALSAAGSLPANCFRQFQVSAVNGAWEDVIGAEATTSSSVTDLYPPTSVPLTYRVRTFKRVPAVIASAWTLSSAVTLNPSSGQPPFGWYLIDIAGFGGPNRELIRVKKWEVSHIEPRGEFQPLTRNAMVVTTAGVKGTLHTITIMLGSKASADALWSLLQVTRPLLFETQYGYRWWVSPRPGSWQQRLVAPAAYSRDIDIELLEVVRPT